MSIRNFFKKNFNFKLLNGSVLHCKKKNSQVTLNVHHLVKIKGQIK